MKSLLLILLFFNLTFGTYSRDVEAPMPTEIENKININDLPSSDVKWGEYQKYIDFVKANHDNIKENVVYAMKEDIDLDQNEEVIIAFGNSSGEPISTYIPYVYILRESNGEIKQIGDNLAIGGYGAYEIKLITIQNMPNKYIYIGITNEGPLKGFMLYELTNNEPKLITYSASATGRGEDSLVDNNNDGQFDGYEQNRSSYDVLYYPLSRKYIWQDKQFVLERTKIEIPQYPTSIKEVIIQYLSLRVLDAEKSSESDQRLGELCTDENADEIDISAEIWYSAIFNTIMLFDNQMEFDIKEADDKANALVAFVDKGNERHELTFLFVKSNNNRWVISRIDTKGEVVDGN